MIYQLPNGRCIEISIDQYLDMTDEELKELGCLGNQYTMELNNPFHKPYAETGKRNEESIKPANDDRVIYLDEMTDEEKLDDKYFHSDDQ